VNDAREMAAAIRQADRIDPEMCRETARARFSAERMIAQYLKLYHRLSAQGVARTAEAGGIRVA